MTQTGSDVAMQNIENGLKTSGKCLAVVFCAGALVFAANKAFGDEQDHQPVAEPTEQTLELSR